MLVASRPSIDQIRAQFPALASGTIFLENAGGTQVPQVVADAIRDYMLTSYVQLGASYEVSKIATETIGAARAFLETYLNADQTGQVIFGPSSSQIFKMLADAYANALEPGAEIIVAQTGHEANISPWINLETRGFRVLLWPVDPHSMSCEISRLESLISSRTKIVALPHTSNLLGDIIDARAIANVAHSAGARVVVDGVAYAPHRAIDVQAVDADWYVYSTYKVFGPHMAVLFGKTEALAELTGPGHFFMPADSPGKWELGCLNHEGCAGILALADYLAFVVGLPAGSPLNREAISDAWSHMSELELPLLSFLISYLLAKPGVRIIGPRQDDGGRVGIVSFLSDRATPSEIVATTDKASIGIRSGHAYAHRLCEGLGIDPRTGVVRVSFAHYNTIDEVRRLIEVLEGVL